MSAAPDSDIGRLHTRLGTLLDGDFFYGNRPEMQRIAVALYRLLSAGSPVALKAIADASGVAMTEVRKRLGDVPPSWIELDQSGSVICFGGLALGATRHRFSLRQSTLYTWCAFDALYLPEILREPARLTTACPATGDTIEVAVGPDELGAVAPSDAVMSIVEPDLDACLEDVRGAFCCHVNLFVDKAAFDRWNRGSDHVTRLSVKDAHALALMRNAARYKDIRLAER